MLNSNDYFVRLSRSMISYFWNFVKVKLWYMLAHSTFVRNKAKPKPRSPLICRRCANGPRRANLVLIAYAVSPEPPLLAHTSSESRGTFWQKARSLAPLNGWACAVKICHAGMLEDTNSLDGAQMIVTMIETLVILLWESYKQFIDLNMGSNIWFPFLC